MKYAMQSNVMVETINATVFVGSSGNAMLSFKAQIGCALSLHIPLSVAKATADAFNAAMAAHEEGEMTLSDFAKEGAA